MYTNFLQEKFFYDLLFGVSAVERSVLEGNVN